jgi:hypothetical protein
MKHFSKILVLFLVGLAAAPAAAVAGSGNRTGTNGASELLIPVGARDIALGGATVATTRGVEALFWNPAGAAVMQNSASIYFSHMTYIADIGVDYGAVSADCGAFGVLAFSLKSLSIGDIDVTTTRDPDGTGQKFSPQYFTLGLTYARQLSERIGVGLTTHIISESMGDVSATGVAFDVGVLYADLGSIHGLNLGVVVKNVGPEMKFSGPGLLTQASVADQNRPAQYYSIQAASFELPSTFEIGLGYRRAFDDANSLLLSTAFQSNNFAGDEYRVGLEYSFQNLLSVRGGYVGSQETTSSAQSLFGPTFGAGLHYDVGSTSVTFDYAFRGTKVFSNTHIVSLTLGL